ncbi:MAG TPA: aspartate/glutamate racemase family protein [Chloroflexi bacterium]|nr:MAG: aspartate racemase [Chloroflexota bacterium]HDD54644.1 aspartate/glutamate racemase family protein [Chloroflexota bacterium]
MKNIGLIGGMSWESSIEYYRIINQQVRAALGGVHSARSVMVSVDFGEIEKLQTEGNWEEATRVMIQCAREVERAGADFILICTNTMHLMAEDVQSAIDIPLLHIADATARAVRAAGLERVGLLGTRFTMEKDFYRGRLETAHGLRVIVPDEEGRALVHRIIYDELVQGKIIKGSREQYLEVIETLIESSAEGIVLGCTEIGLLVKGEDVRIPVFDTMEIHALAAVDAALGRYDLG